MSEIIYHAGDPSIRQSTPRGQREAGIADLPWLTPRMSIWQALSWVAGMVTLFGAVVFAVAAMVP